MTSHEKNSASIAGLRSLYKGRRNEIRKRLREFQEGWNETDQKVFAELCFCLCTPQSSAKKCDLAIQQLVKNKNLYTGNAVQIGKELRKGGVRFHNTKSKRITEARKTFSNSANLDVKEKLVCDCSHDPYEMRNWLVENVNGMGMKEASHFLRNVGFYNELSILDRHILKNLYSHGAIDEIPKTISPKQYLEIETRMKSFAKKAGVPFPELDLLFWSMETGEVFK